MFSEKKRLLFITCNNYEDTSYGGGQCSNRNLRALEQLAHVIKLRIKKKSSLRSFKTLLHGFYPPIERNDLILVEKMISSERIDIVFLDGSIFGIFAREIKIKFPKVKILTFFHNVEFDYIDVRFGKKIRKYLYRRNVKINESYIVKNSDELVALNERDSKRIEGLYLRKPNSVIPITFEDRASLPGIGKVEEESGDICLIVGSMKRDTYEGVEWFVNKVSPFINAKTLIVGKGFEKRKIELSNSKVEVIGTVDNLDEYYKKASYVALPILSGAGMKVKTAEAMMYGKTIFGTKEAFEGYDFNYSEAGGLCNNAQDFIEQINMYSDKHSHGNFNNYTRNVFKDKYSFNTSDELFDEIISRI